jgi:23S rRNA (cytosine1962-C5)-methyltransferase
MGSIEEFANRLRKSARHWGRWARRRGIACYRIYDRDIPEFAFAVDRYGAYAQLQEYDRRVASGSHASETLAEVARATASALDLPLARVALKRRARRESGEQHEKTGKRRREIVVEEAGHRFLVDLWAYLDTGLFLDHRTTRALVASEAPGKRFLNLFCYTGSFTIYAATAGAVESLSVDLSNTYLAWAARNFALNGIDPARHRLERADVTRWLPRAAATGLRFDLILVDPPSFSTSKAMTSALDIQRDYAGLLQACARLLARDGALYFSTNLRTFRFDSARVPSLAAEEISHRTLPEDFRNRRIHRCWRMTRAA